MRSALLQKTPSGQFLMVGVLLSLTCCFSLYSYLLTSHGARQSIFENGGGLAPLFAAVAAACGPQRLAPKVSTTPTSQCVAAQQALKGQIAKDRAENAGEAGTEGTAADMSEDKAEMAQIFSLMKNIGTACGFDRLGADTFRTDSFGR